jgi:hypothetical protein
LLSVAAAPQKIIIDTDFNTIGDDGQVLVMAAQLQAAGALDILGLTVLTGNAWRDQEISDALKAVERLGIEWKITGWRRVRETCRRCGSVNSAACSDPLCFWERD